MATIGSLSVLLKGDSSSLVKATRSGLKAVQGFGAAAAKAVGLAAAIGTGAAAGLAALGNAARASIDAHAKNAARLGLTVTEAQKLALVAEQSDVAMRTLNTTFAALTREAGLAAAGNEKAAEKFEALGISMDQVRDASPFQLFKLVIGRLGSLTTFTERAAKANALFGDTWLKLNPLINAGNAAFEDADRIYTDLGLGVGAAAADVERFNDKLDTLAKIGLALRDKVFATLAPRLAEIAAVAVEATLAFIEMQGGGAQLARTLSGSLVGGIASVIDFFRSLQPAIEGVLRVAQFLVDVVQAVGVAGAGLIAATEQVAEGNFSGAGAVLRAIPGDVAAQFGADAGNQQLQETKRQTRILEDIFEVVGRVTFQ